MMTAFAKWLSIDKTSPVGTTVKNSCHHQSLKRRKQDLNLHRTGVLALFNEVVKSRDNHWTYF